jgi:hypothetical protein
MTQIKIFVENIYPYIKGKEIEEKINKFLQNKKVLSISTVRIDDYQSSTPFKYIVFTIAYEDKE